MKRAKLIFIIGTIVGIAAVAFAVVRQGSGKIIEADSSCAEVSFVGLEVYRVGVSNQGTNALYAMVNCTVAELSNAIASATALPIPPAGNYTFDGDSGRRTERINNVCVGTASAAITNTVYVGGF